MSDIGALKLNKDQMLALLAMGAPKASPNPGLAPVFAPMVMAIQPCPDFGPGFEEDEHEDDVPPHAHVTVACFTDDNPSSPYLTIAIDYDLDTGEARVNEEETIRHTMVALPGMVMPQPQGGQDDHPGGMYL